MIVKFKKQCKIMCICINCRHINMCNMYNFIQKQHSKEKSKVNNKICFYPIDTTIYVSFYKTKKLLDWDLKECSSFIEKPGSWLEHSKHNDLKR